MPDPISTSVLPNGVRILSRSMPAAHSAALGIWLVNGGRHQTSEQRGYAHLMEHLLFKGTRDLDAQALAQRFEAMGGQVNAHTGRELTALHGLVPGDDLPELLELLLAMLLAPAFTDEDLAIEREVVLQEMAMIADTPEEAVEEHAVQCAWPDHPGGWPILGDIEVLQRATARVVHAYLRDLLRGGRIVVAAAGKVDHDALVRGCAALAQLPAGDAPTDSAPRFRAGAERTRHALSQSHLLWLLPAPPVGDAQRARIALANHLLGGGTSSRLFQEVRERRGLAYGIHSRLEQYSDCGLWHIQTACETRRADECRGAVEQIIAELTARGPAADELDHARRHLRAGLLLESDDVEASMERLAREAIYLGRHPTLEERCAELDAATADAVRDGLAQAWREILFVQWSPEKRAGR